MDFSVTVIVDVADSRCDNQLPINDPIAYAKQFVSLSAMTRGEHHAIKDGEIIQRLNVVDAEVTNLEAYVI